jgi:hypothetical protein
LFFEVIGYFVCVSVAIADGGCFAVCLVVAAQTGWNSTGTFKLFAGFAICQWLPGSAGQPACSKGIQVP